MVFAIPPGHVWQLVLGYILLLKGAVFILTAFLTLFSQLLGHRTSPAIIGALMGVYALGAGGRRRNGCLMPGPL